MLLKLYYIFVESVFANLLIKDKISKVYFFLIKLGTPKVNSRYSSTKKITKATKKNTKATAQLEDSCFDVHIRHTVLSWLGHA